MYRQMFIYQITGLQESISIKQKNLLNILNLLKELISIKQKHLLNILDLFKTPQDWNKNSVEK